MPFNSGEQQLQHLTASQARALQFEDRSLKDRLTPLMQRFIATQSFFWLATADASGRSDCSFRAGPPGFVRVVDDQTLVYPEYRGNGVFASLGNLLENPQCALLFLDLTDTTVGLHVNGRASVAPTAAGEQQPFEVRIAVEEAYIHCAKHVPKLVPVDKPVVWGTDDPILKRTDFFDEAASPRGESAES